MLTAIHVSGRASVEQLERYIDGWATTLMTGPTYEADLDDPYAPHQLLALCSPSDLTYISDRLASGSHVCKVVSAYADVRRLCDEIAGAARWHAVPST
jgi:hypothetical protein